MYLVNNIKELHIELTDKCQAQCPMCPRNYNGYGTRSFIKNKDISINEFIEWFPKSFLSQLSTFYSCGNYGDPAFAADCLEIFSYVRECNPTIKLGIHTNGGMRNPSWWKKLAKAIGNINGSYCTFAIDGVKGKHELYRRNTNFDKVIENLKAYVDGGGRTFVDSLVFKHNEDDVDELENFLLNIGVDSVNFISTTRFYEMKKFDVFDSSSKYAYSLYPSETARFKKNTNNTLTSLLNVDYRNKIINEAVIDPQCLTNKGIYVDSSGNIYPCCLIGHDYVSENLKEILPIHVIHNISINHTRKLFNKLGIPNCKDKMLHSNKILFKDFDKTWSNNDKCPACIKACSKTIYDRSKNVQG